MKNCDLPGFPPVIVGDAQNELSNMRIIIVAVNNNKECRSARGILILFAPSSIEALK
jgi:hypothetical protein